MNYSEINTKLFKEFNLENKCHILGDPNYKLFSINFKSQVNTSFDMKFDNPNSRNVFFENNSLVDKNANFKYPVIVPENNRARNEAIILLHGLNERNWNKYLPWAYRLAETTGKSVILFPLAFHMNRSPEIWKNPRQMLPFVHQRLSYSKGIQNSTVANIALSERLSTEPERFFLSGYQSAIDVCQLIEEIKKGEHPLFEANTSVNLFAYSIGAFLAEVLLLSDQRNLLDNSKIFLFCGGCAFSELNGNSRYILDSRAFKTISEYYSVTRFVTRIKNTVFNRLINDTAIGQAFIAMLSTRKINKLSPDKLNKFSEQIKVVGLLKDKVVPVKGLKKTLKKVELKIFDFDYEYSHEMPFPENNDFIKEKVNEAFNMVFEQASLQLC